MIQQIHLPNTQFPGRLALFAALLVSLGGCGGGSEAVVTGASSQNSDRVYDDAFWAELAQSYQPFVAEPNIGSAQSPADLINQGRWGEVIDWPEIATGAANLPDGRMMTWSSSGESSFGGGQPFTHGSLFDPTTGLFEPNDNPTHNMFCAGVSMLADGEVFAAGGGATITTTSIYSDAGWSLTDEMNRPRWYPTSTTLATGQVLTSLGDKFQPYPEIWTPGQGWELRTNMSMQLVLDDSSAINGQRHWYPALNVAPNGTLFHAGPTSQLFSLNPSQQAGITVHGPRDITDIHRLYNTTVMYDVGKMLVAGGGTPALSSALDIDINSATPQVTSTNPMNFPRSMHNTVVLPDGKVLVVGGNSSGIQFSDDGTQLTPEMWDPATGQWQSLAPHSVPRNYHSTALLLKDGRVAVMGGGLCGGCATNHQNGEIFEPPYLFNPDGSAAARPTISGGAADATAGSTIALTGSDDITAFNMLRLVALTHHHSSDQRLIPVSFQKPASGNYQLSLPTNPNVVLPGYYWIFAVNDEGVPSIGHTINVGVSTSLTATDLPQTNAVAFSYYEGSWNTLPDFDTLTPVASGTDNSFNIASAQRDDEFAFRFDAMLSVPVNGEYTFITHSDDGSQLFINDQLVVNNDGVHAPREQQGTVILPAGEHPIRVTFFERQGGQVLSVQWSGPGFSRQDITSALVPQTLAPPQGENQVSNSDFEQNLAGWQNCSGNPVFQSSASSASGSSAALVEGCVFTEFRVQPGETYHLSCAANPLASPFSSITLGFNDNDFQSLASQEIEVDQPGYNTYSRQVTAPDLAQWAALVLYAETGGSLFDRCEVLAGSAAPEPPSVVSPQPIEAPANNLIANSAFEQDLSGWDSCAANTTIAASTAANSGQQALSLNGCAFTEFAVTANTSYRLSCFGQPNDSRYASITLGYSDALFNDLQSQEIPLTGSGYGEYTLDLQAPPNSVNGALTLYADGGEAQFDDCFVTPLINAR